VATGRGKSGLLGFRREMRGWLGCVEVEKPPLEGGDEGNDRGKRGKSILGLWICGGKEWSGRERGRLVREKIGNSCSGGSLGEEETKGKRLESGRRECWCYGQVSVGLQWLRWRNGGARWWLA